VDGDNDRLKIKVIKNVERFRIPPKVAVSSPIHQAIVFVCRSIPEGWTSVRYGIFHVAKIEARN